MFTSHPRPNPQRAWARQIGTLLVSMCMALLAIGVGASARTARSAADPAATISSAALRSALAARAAADHALAHSSGRLRRCLRAHGSRCATQRRAVKRSRAQLAAAERRVRGLEARIARRHHTLAGGHPPSGPGETSSGAGGSLASIGGKGDATLGGFGTGESLANGSSASTGSASTSGRSGSTTGGDGTGENSSNGTSSGTSGGGAGEGSTGAEPGSSSNPFDEPFVKGIVTNIQGWGASAMPQISSEMSTLGVNWAREDLAWSNVEPQKGVFDWSSFDQMVSAATAKGITVLPIVGYAPSWAGPTDASDYAAFMRAAVERYGPGTSANLQWWELWNEPYDAYAWSGHTPEPEAYARDVLAAAQAARGVSPSVKLLVAADYDDAPQAGGSTPWQTSWIDDMFTAVPSLGQWINGVAVHPYGDDPSLALAEPEGWKDAHGEWAFQRIDMVRKKFLAHGVNVPFWITEDGWSTWEVSEATQAHDYSDLIEQVKARPWIRALFPFCLREFEEKATNNQPGFGLLKFGTWQPKSAFYTLQAGLKTLS